MLTVTNVTPVLLCQQLCANHPGCAYFTTNRQNECILKRRGAIKYRVESIYHAAGPASCTYPNSSKTQYTMIIMHASLLYCLSSSRLHWKWLWYPWKHFPCHNLLHNKGNTLPKTLCKPPKLHIFHSDTKKHLLFQVGRSQCYQNQTSWLPVWASQLWQKPSGCSTPWSYKHAKRGYCMSFKDSICLRPVVEAKFHLLGCFEYEFDYQGETVATEDSTSSERCQELCGNNPSCVYFTYFEGSNKCHLKGKDAVKGRMKNDSAISGPVSCHIPDASK